ncbi:MAG: hypothetical protein JXQ65_00980 [Candidatus Marinimicrobia bacterium]|nr:hypothetical protein [Candidatus Neomarinimicrobiota bacterium]
MRYIYFLILCLVPFLDCMAQNQLSVELSPNKFAVGYQYNNFNFPIKPKIKIGVSNQDIDTGFNDIFINASAKMQLRNRKNFGFYSQIHSGIYIANNAQYHQNLIFWGSDFGFNYNITNEHQLFIEIGYQSGKKYYIESYHNQYFTAISIEKLVLSPINLSVGYCINF